MDKRWNLIHYAKVCDYLGYIHYIVYSNLEINLLWYASLHQTYVRDIYPFRRSVSPQLNLVHMLPEKGQELIQKQVL